MADDGPTYDEQVDLALKIMLEQPQRDLEAGQRWQHCQRRTIRIKEDENG